MKPLRTVAVAGHICVDIRPQLGVEPRLTPGILQNIGKMEMSLGGCVANTGRALTELGCTIRAFASVGDDDLGAWAQSRLEALPGIESRAHVVEGASTSYSIILEPEGVDRTIWHHIGANRYFSDYGFSLADVDLFHLGYPPLLPALVSDGATALMGILDRAQAAGATTSVDLAVVSPDGADSDHVVDWPGTLRDMASRTDVLSPSLDDLTSAFGIEEPFSADLVERLARRFLQWGVAVVAISAGSAGLFVFTASEDRLLAGGRCLEAVASTWADKTLHIAPLWVETPVTTNGAGDASTAGLLFGLAAATSLIEAGRIAAGCSAAVVGGIPITPALTAPHPNTAPRPPAAHHTDRTGRLMRPLILGPNQPADRFYAGGAQIAGFRGVPHDSDRTPEDWVGSTTSVRGQHPEGLTQLDDERTLADAVAEDPVNWLGSAHVERFGSDPKLLVKLLDAGQRLPVHAHPDGHFAHRTLGALHGKAEAWYILTPGRVYLGLKSDVTMHELADLVTAQDTVGLLDLLNPVDVEPHQTVYVPPGVLHAIGEGILLLEVQEPEDLSILLEWKGFDIDGTTDGHLGLGFEQALQAVERSARTGSDLDALFVTSETSAGAAAETLAPAAAEYFRLRRLRTTNDAVVELEATFSVITVTAGSVSLRSADGSVVQLRTGSTCVVPHAAGALQASGNGELLIALPPATQ